LSPLRLQLKLPSRSKAAFPLPKVDLLMNGHVVFGESYLVADLHLVEEPIRITLENLGKVNSNVASRLAKSVHDSAQGRFVDAEHSRKAILTDASRIHPQLQVRVNVSIQGHGFALAYLLAAAFSSLQKEQLLPLTVQSKCQSRSRYLSTYCCQSTD